MIKIASDRRRNEKDKLSLSLSLSFSFSDGNVYVKEYKSGIPVSRNIRYARLVSDGNCPLKVSISALDIKGSPVRVRQTLPLLANAISACFRVLCSRNCLLTYQKPIRVNPPKRAFNDADSFASFCISSSLSSPLSL